MCTSRIGSEALDSLACPDVRRNAVHLNRTSGISQASYSNVRKSITACMTCTSWPKCDVFKLPRAAAGSRSDRPASEDLFPRFKNRRKQVMTGRAHAFQAEMVRTESQEAATAYNVHYKVKEGDTLTSIARKFKTTVQSIALSNQIVDIDYIAVGKVLLLSIQSRHPNVVSGEGNSVEHPSAMGYPQDAKLSINIQKGSSPLAASMPSSYVSGQFGLVNVASSVVILFVIIGFAKRYLQDLKTKMHIEILRRQAEKEIKDANHRPKLRRWQGILNEDRQIEDLDSSIDAPNLMKSQMSNLESEEEKLRQSYAQLESRYAKFLADSGLSKSGYWRGGVPPSSEED